VPVSPQQSHMRHDPVDSGGVSSRVGALAARERARPLSKAEGSRSGFSGAPTYPTRMTAAHSTYRMRRQET
jgi:hypothetical protein